jgi:hypothetical protein
MNSLHDYIGFLILVVLGAVLYFMRSKKVIDWIMKKRLIKELKQMRGEK